MFAVGKLEEFHPKLVRTEDVIDKLAVRLCFRNVNKEFINKLKIHFSTFVSRVDTAAKGSDDSYWHTLCNEPKSKLKSLWKVKKEIGKGPKSEEQKREESEKNLMQAMYYCLYIILFWRHENSFRRYKAHIRDIEDFQASYEKDDRFPRERMDTWETLFSFRNVMILAAAIKPSTRNKGLFTKLGCILAEDRIHSMGGGQSFAADRRGRIYDTEGSVYAAAPLTLCNKVEILFDETLSLPAVKVECSTALTPSKKHKRQQPEFTSTGSCVPPTLSRTNSLNPRMRKLSRNDTPVSIIDLDAEMDWLLQDGDFTENALMRNMSLNQLCEDVNCEAAETDVSSNAFSALTVEMPAPINLHNAYVVGRAFSYNAYAYNNHVETPLLGAAPSTEADPETSQACVEGEDSIDFLVDVVSSSCAIDFNAVAPNYNAATSEADLLTSANDSLNLCVGDFCL